MKTKIRKEVIPFVLRYVTTHTLTYLVFGIFFMLLSQYWRSHHRARINRGFPIYSVSLQSIDRISRDRTTDASIFMAILSLADK